MQANRSNLVRFGVPIVAAVLILAVAITMFGNDGSANNGTDSENEYQVQPVPIESIDVLLAESYPVQVFVTVEGYLPDPCWEPREPVIETDGSRFTVEIVAERKAADFCAQVIEPYEKNIALGTLEPGNYVISVNGVEQEFEVH